ncbi:hypothetical protein F5B21DRAFT_481657 [Xylaria acuta]|nr:hypothetical protein F5B21DRAFT_481657 [Xylaria acuta]
MFTASFFAIFVGSLYSVVTPSSDIVNTTLPVLRSKVPCAGYTSPEAQMKVISASIHGIPASHQATKERLAININGEEH